jgi:hypothetical protein
VPQLTKHLKHLIAQRADAGDGKEVTDLATGAFVNPDDEGEEADEEEERRLDDNVTANDDDLVLLDSKCLNAKSEQPNKLT